MHMPQPLKRALKRTAHAAVLGLALLGAASQAESPPERVPPVPLEFFFQHARTLEAKLSPSGDYLALTTSHGSDRVALVVVSFKPSIQAQRIAHYKDADVIDFHWTSDQRLVFSVGDLKDDANADEYAPGLIAMDRDGKNQRLLVKRQAQFVTGGGADRSLEWNHMLLWSLQNTAAEIPNEVIVGRLNFSGDRQLQSVTPLWLNTETGRTRNAGVLGAPDNVQQWLFDNNGQVRLAIALDKGRVSAHWRDLKAENTWRTLFDTPPLEAPFDPIAVDTQGALYVNTNTGAQGEAELKRFDFSSGRPEAQAIVSTPGFDFTGRLRMEAGQLMGVDVLTDARQTVWLKPELKALQALADEKLPGRINVLSCRRCSQADAVVLVHSYSDRSPGEYWIYRAAEKQWETIGGVRPEIDPRRMASVDFQRIKTRDGRDMPVWITLPQGVKPGKPAPTVVMVHGGPWVRGGQWEWEPMEQFLASRGYLVIAPEFRGSTGYGAQHYRASFKQWGQAMQDDVADALLWARKEGLADPERACIAGASYGGYATLMGLIRHPELYRCGVSWVAVTDLPLLVEGSWRVNDDTGNFRKYGMADTIGRAKEDRAMLEANSPVHQAARLKRPVLLAMGENDVRVPLAHGTRMREALEKAGNPPQYVVYPGEGHGWRKVKNRVDFAQRVEAFLQQHIGNAP
ncbi:alpha/beta hydrolase family protein [Roseateles sp. BYS180W]|uniref:Alpha/beta hydrolase family protein n=1 Tax=Roseateles rivi TaxID=3299028 RepID=A0ABW7FSF1_9BURK